MILGDYSFRSQREPTVAIVLLDPSVQDADGLRKLMEYFDAYDGLSVYAVSNAVNSVGHDGPELIKPTTPGEPRTLF